MAECVKGIKQWTVNTEGCNSEFFSHLHTEEFSKAMEAKYVFQCSKLKIISSLNMEHENVNGVISRIILVLGVFLG